LNNVVLLFSFSNNSWCIDQSNPQRMGFVAPQELNGAVVRKKRYEKKTNMNKAKTSINET